MRIYFRYVHVRLGCYSYRRSHCESYPLFRDQRRYLQSHTMENRLESILFNL